MNNKLLFDDELNEQDFCPKDSDFCLAEIDFYPPSDNRYWQSNVIDINGGDNFADFCEDYFELLDEEEYFDN